MDRGRNFWLSHPRSEVPERSRVLDCKGWQNRLFFSLTLFSSQRADFLWSVGGALQGAKHGSFWLGRFELSFETLIANIADGVISVVKVSNEGLCTIHLKASPPVSSPSNSTRLVGLRLCDAIVVEDPLLNVLALILGHLGYV